MRTDQYLYYLGSKRYGGPKGVFAEGVTGETWITNNRWNDALAEASVDVTCAPYTRKRTRPGVSNRRALEWSGV
jgi:hypothetical protein